MKAEMGHVDAAIAHHIIDAQKHLEHLRIDLAKTGASPTTQQRADHASREMAAALALIRGEP